MQREDYSFACHSIILLLESEKNVLPLSKADTDLTFQQEQASWGSLQAFLQFLFSFQVFSYCIKFYCNENISDQEVRYVLNMPSGL